MDEQDSHSESGDDLSRCNVASSQPKDELANETIHCPSASDVLAERSRKQDTFKTLDVCESMKTRGESSTNNVLENDETKAIIEQDNDLKVQSTTLYCSPDYKFLKEISGSIFNHSTMSVRAFMGDECYLALLSEIEKEENLEHLVSNQCLYVMIFPKDVTQRLCCYLFYLMSVHPDFSLVLGCHSYLCTQEDYVPTFSDIVTVVCNWGAAPRDMFQIAPNNFQGIPCALLGRYPSAECKIENFNMELLLKYVIVVLKTKTPASYANLLGPMLQFSVNDLTYFTPVKTCVLNIVWYMASMKDHMYSVENLHQKNLSLRNQFIICTKSLDCTVLQEPVAYATLQQFLGESEIKYTTNVDMQDVFNLVITNRNNIVREDLNDTCCILKLIDQLVWRFAREENTCEYFEKWIGLLQDLSLDIQENGKMTDSVLLMDEIAQLIRMINTFPTCGGEV